MKILLAVDGSKASLKAVKCLLTQAAWYRERPSVRLVYVHPPVPRLPRMNLVVSAKQIQRFYEEDARKALVRAKRLLEAKGVPYSARLLVGPVAETIVREAVRGRCDLIVLGTRGMTAAANMLLGSTATRVLHVSPVPVLLAK